MKELFTIVDNVSGEIVETFQASNEKHAIKMIEQSIQKQPMDIEFTVYKIPCTIDYDSMTDKFIFIADSKFNDFDSKVIYKYPNDIKMTENIIKNDISKEE